MCLVFFFSQTTQKSLTLSFRLPVRFRHRAPLAFCLAGAKLRLRGFCLLLLCRTGLDCCSVPQRIQAQAWSCAFRPHASALFLWLVLDRVNDPSHFHNLPPLQESWHSRHLEEACLARAAADADVPGGLPRASLSKKRKLF